MDIQNLTEEIDRFPASNFAARLILCSASKTFRESLRKLLRFDAVMIVEDAESISKARLILEIFPNVKVLVYEVVGQGENAFYAVKTITDRFPDVGVVVLADAVTRHGRDLAILAGAKGLFSKKITGEALRTSLASIIFGKTVFTGPEWLAGVVNHPDGDAVGPPLSACDDQLFRCPERRLPNSEVIQELEMMDAVVQSHLRRLLRKINACELYQPTIWGVNPKRKIDGRENSVPQANLRSRITRLRG